MKKRTYTTMAIFFAACLLQGMMAPAFAQTNSESLNEPPPDVEQSETVLTPDQQNTDARYSVLMITSVEAIHSDHAPALDIIRVRGLTSTTGWSDPELLPLTEGTPKDGFLNLVLVAHAPSEAMEPTGFSPIALVFPIRPGHPDYTGVRVYGAANSVTLRTMPGYVEAKPVLKDCGGCIGKYFVATGASAPAGINAENIVRQQDLPSSLRIIKPSEGISMTGFNPNRLTLLLDDDGRITDGVWN
jgi:hypothetical protein